MSLIMIIHRPKQTCSKDHHFLHPSKSRSNQAFDLRPNLHFPLSAFPSAALRQPPPHFLLFHRPRPRTHTEPHDSLGLPARFEKLHPGEVESHDLALLLECPPEVGPEGYELCAECAGGGDLVGVRSEEEEEEAGEEGDVAVLGVSPSVARTRLWGCLYWLSGHDERQLQREDK